MECECLAAGRVDLVGGFSGRVAGKIIGRDGCPLGREGQGGRAANAGTGAGYENGLVFEAHFLRGRAWMTRSWEARS